MCMRMMHQILFGRVPRARGGGGVDVNCMDLSNDGRYCAAGTRGCVTLWDLTSDAGERHESQGQNTLSSAAALSSALFATGADILPQGEQNPGLSKLDNYGCSSLLGHNGRVLDASFSMDARFLLTAGESCATGATGERFSSIARRAAMTTIFPLTARLSPLHLDLHIFVGPFGPVFLGRSLWHSRFLTSTVGCLPT